MADEQVEQQAEPMPQAQSADAPDIDAQLDALMNQVKEAQSNEAPDAESAKAADGDELADQIQQVLDEAKDQTESAQVAQPDDAQEVNQEQPEPTMAADPVQDMGPATEDEVVDQLDRLLDESGDDDDFAGAFETVEEVIGETDAPAAPATAPQPVAESPQPVAEAPQPEARDQTPPAQEEEDFEFEGNFAAPEDVVAETETETETESEPKATAGATAQDVAAELDAQPQPVDAKPPAPITEAEVEPNPVEADAADTRTPRRERLKAVITAAPDKTKQVCAVINKPMNWVGDETRDLIGYVGLITLFNASAVLIYKIITTTFGG